MAEHPEINPTLDLQVPGFILVGRGCSSSGWSRNPETSYRCAERGSVVSATQDDFFECAFGALFLDVDYHRFGSRLGDHNILVYSKSSSSGFSLMKRTATSSSSKRC